MSRQTLLEMFRNLFSIGDKWELLLHLRVKKQPQASDFLNCYTTVSFLLQCRPVERIEVLGAEWLPDLLLCISSIWASSLDSEEMQLQSLKGQWWNLFWTCFLMWCKLHQKLLLAMGDAQMRSSEELTPIYSLYTWAQLTYGGHTGPDG